MAAPPYPAPASRRSEASLRELLPRMTSEAGVLVRKDLEMAKVEAKEQASLAAKAGVMFSGAAIVGFVAFQLVSIAAALGLATVLPDGLAFLIVGVVYLIAAAAAAARARKIASGVSLVPQQALDSMKEDVKWLRARLS